MDFFNEINSHKYINLDVINEGKDGALCIIIKEAGANSGSVNIDAAGIELSAQAIVSSENSRIYEIRFESYIGYSIVDESYALPNDDEDFEGRLFCIYEESTYLNFISKASCASEDYPGPFKHYGFNCLNHIIDVASEEEPIIKVRP